MITFTLVNILMLLLFLALLIGVGIIFYFIFKQKLDKKKVNRSNNAECSRVISEHTRRLYTDYFWSDYMRFAWIMLFLIFSIAFGIALGTTITILISILFILATVYFLYFSIQSYKAFPAKAAERLKAFEAQVEAAVQKEIYFDADNIQRFSNTDEEFDTNPEIFSFPTEVTKIPFPPLETQAAKHPIIATRKLEFLILSREYFSICKGAATFNLLDPKRAGPPKKCAELPGSAGECHEYYYSQIRNAYYDDKDEAIHIVYYDDTVEDIIFKCKKAAPNRKPAMKALKGKLRLTERQKLRKIDEHEKYENILKRRGEPKDEQNQEDKEES